MSNMLIFVLYSILAFTLIHLISFGYIRYRRSKKPPVTLITNHDKMESIEYSERIMKFVKDLILELSITRFKEFVDSKDMNKVYKPNYENMASETAKEVYRKINLNNILFQYTLFTREYFEEFIVHYAIDVNKSLILKYYESNGGNI